MRVFHFTAISFLVTSANGADQARPLALDIGYQVVRGDEAFVAERRPIVLNIRDYPEVSKLILAKDVEGIEGLTKRGVMAWTDSPTKVRVLDTNGRMGPTMIEVRILDGPRRGDSGYCLNGSVFRALPEIQPAPPRQPATSKRVQRKAGPVPRPSIPQDEQRQWLQDRGMELDLQQKQSWIVLFDELVPKLSLPTTQRKTVGKRLHSLAKECEAAGDVPEAAAVYRLIVREYPGSPEAAEADAWLRGSPGSR